MTVRILTLFKPEIDLQDDLHNKIHFHYSCEELNNLEISVRPLFLRKETICPVSLKWLVNEMFKLGFIHPPTQNPAVLNPAIM